MLHNIHIYIYVCIYVSVYLSLDLEWLQAAMTAPDDSNCDGMMCVVHCANKLKCPGAQT